MTITHGFFASNDVENPTTYTQVQYARERALTIMNGIHDGIGSNFTVSASDPTAMSVVVGSGAVHAQGYWMESDAETTLQIAAADENYPRIDRVVIRVDIVANLEVSFAVLTGIASSSPTVPELTQTSAIYEIPLAQVSVAAGVTSVTAAAITDERDYRDTQNLIHHPVVYKSPAGVQSRIAYDNAGSFWMARNATYNPSTNSWTQDNTAQSSTAVRLNAGGSIELLFCESGNETIEWIPSNILCDINSDHVVGLENDVASMVSSDISSWLSQSVVLTASSDSSALNNTTSINLSRATGGEVESSEYVIIPMRGGIRVVMTGTLRSTYVRSGSSIGYMRVILYVRIYRPDGSIRTTVQIAEATASSETTTVEITNPEATISVNAGESLKLRAKLTQIGNYGGGSISITQIQIYSTGIIIPLF